MLSFWPFFLFSSLSPFFFSPLFVTGGRDGSVRLWSRSSTAAVDSNEYVEHLYNTENDNRDDMVPQKSRSIASMFQGSKSTSGGGGGGGSHQAEKVGMGGWYLANMMPGAHGSSEFVTCAAGPGAAAGASGGWVATGGTDWSVRGLMFSVTRCRCW